MNLSSTTTLEYEYWKFFWIIFLSLQYLLQYSISKSTCSSFFRVRIELSNGDVFFLWLPIGFWRSASASTVGSSKGLCKNLTRQSSSLVRKKIDSCISLEGHATRKCKYLQGALNFSIGGKSMCNWYNYKWAK